MRLYKYKVIYICIYVIFIYDIYYKEVAHVILNLRSLKNQESIQILSCSAFVLFRTPTTG